MSHEPTPDPLPTSAPETPAQASAEPAPQAAPTPTPAPAQESPDPTESFGDLLSQFEQSHRPDPAANQLEGAVISISPDSVYLDIGYKTEGVLPRSAFRDNADAVKPGDRFRVSVKGRNPERYYVLSLARVAQPTDWTQLEKAHAEKLPIPGAVTGVIKGGLTVDIGVRAFLPASRSGTRDAAEMEKLVGQEITCRITQLDVADENVIVDRRSVLEEEALAAAAGHLAALREGDTVQGAVSRLAPFGAFIDLGGIDGLLHISDMSWSRVAAPEDIVQLGQQIEVRILKIDRDSRRISLGLKQLQPEPWDAAAGKYKAGARATGTVTRLTDFGAFVELEPGIEGMIHVSEMSWIKKVRRPADILKTGDTVEAIILSVNQPERRMALGLKQALGDPWADAAAKFPAGAAIEGPVTRMEKFGAFVQMAEGVEGLVHISEITPERRLAHPSDALHIGQIVRAQVLALDPEKRQAKLSMKQLVPTSLDEYLAERHPGDLVSGRVIDVAGTRATVELGEGIRAACRLQPGEGSGASTTGAADLSALTSLLQSKWKGKTPSGPEPLRPGQVRNFRIATLDREAKTIQVELP